MDTAEAFADRLSQRLYTIDPPYHVRPGHDARGYIQMLFSDHTLAGLGEDLATVFNEEQLERFFKGHVTEQYPASAALDSFLFNSLPRNCTITQETKIQIDREGLLSDVNRLVEAVSTNTFEVTISLRIAR